jgi:AraC-like DNA-binding protein
MGELKLAQNEEIKFRHIKDFYNIDVIQGINVERQFPKHSHSKICLGVINKGTRVCSIDKKQIYVDKGKIFVLNKSQVHSFTSLDKATHDYMCMCFDGNLFENTSEEIKHTTSSELFFNKNIFEDSNLYMLINRLCSNLLTSTIDLEKEELLFKIIEKLTIKHSSSIFGLKKIGREQRVVKLLREYIEDNYKCNISSNQLSEVSGLSSFYLIRLFSEEYGFAPHSYQNNIRIKKVKQLLLKGEMSMADLALEVGFVDQSHMIKQFKKSVGITPNRYFQEMKK